jgi:taurine transport system permease protein
MATASPLTSIEQDRPAEDRAVAVGPVESRRGRLRSFGLTVLSILVVLTAWWLASALDVWSDLILPSPAKVWDAFVYSMSSHDGRPGYFEAYLWQHLWASVWRIVNGVFRAVIVGVPLGIAVALWRPLAALTEPWINFLRSLPPLAYFVLFIMWFGIGDTAKIWLLFVAALPPIVLATIAGVHRVRRDRIDAARALGASQFQVIRFTILPSILPDLFVGLRVATGFAWTTIVAAETVNGLPGIGGMAWATRSQNRADIAIMCIVVIGITAVAMDQMIQLAERAAVPWRGNP